MRLKSSVLDGVCPFRRAKRKETVDQSAWCARPQQLCQASYVGGWSPPDVFVAPEVEVLLPPLKTTTLRLKVPVNWPSTVVGQTARTSAIAMPWAREAPGYGVEEVMSQIDGERRALVCLRNPGAHARWLTAEQ